MSFAGRRPPLDRRRDGRVAVLLLAMAVPALAASPTPAPAATRAAPGKAPGSSGDPAFAILAVVLIAAGSILAHARLRAR